MYINTCIYIYRSKKSLVFEMTEKKVRIITINDKM